MVYYSQREGDQCYQRTLYHSRRSMIQTYYEVEFHLLTLSVLCLMSYVCWLIVFVTYHSYFVCLCSEKTKILGMTTSWISMCFSIIGLRSKSQLLLEEKFFHCYGFLIFRLILI